MSDRTRQGETERGWQAEREGFDPLEDLDRTTRLARLAGRRCPLCAEPSLLCFDGRRLRCTRAHTWSNPDAAEADIVTDRPRPISEQRQIRDRADRAECARVLDELEAAVGGWPPPEARRD